MRLRALREEIILCSLHLEPARASGIGQLIVRCKRDSGTAALRDGVEATRERLPLPTRAGP